MDGQEKTVGRLFEELKSLSELVDSGDSGLPAIQRITELAQRWVGGVAGTFVEYGADGGRVIAGVGAARWAVGRGVDLNDRQVARVVRAGRIIDVPTTALPTELADQMVGRGLGWMLAGRVEFAGRMMATVHTYFPAADYVSTPEQRAAIAYFAAYAGHLYAGNRGLPVYAAGPTRAVSRTEAVVIVAGDETVVSINPIAAQLIGESTATMFGRRLPIPVPGTGQVLEHRLADGRWVQLVGAELPGGACLITLTDITEARRKEQARDLFVSVTSHELRTPVTVVKGYADTLVNHWGQLADAERLEAATRLGQRAGELARLVERLLNAVGEGSVLAAEPVGVPFDLTEAIRGGIDELPSELRRLVEVDWSDEPVKALGDRASIATVLAELVTNAVKYSPPESMVSIAVLADERMVGFAVADRGIGVRSEHVERAFERFWQAETGNQRRYSGVGLGLYFVRRMIERQNGWVSLRPRDQGGTVAEVRLPRADLGPGEAWRGDSSG